MQEDINQKSFALTFKATKLTAGLLKTIIVAAYRKHKENKNEKKRMNPNASVKHGKQTFKSLQSQGQELTDIEITDDNIKSFDKYARKYNIDYCLKADKTQTPPQWYVFFKARDRALIDVALKEYAADNALGKKKPSIREKLKAARKKVRSLPQRQKTRKKTKNRSQTR